MAADPLTTTTVDDLLLQDATFDSDDDPFADKPPRNTERDDKSTLSPRKRKAEDDNPFGSSSNNIDEEIKITKQRKKIPKLDADRLLSDPGIPKLRKLVRPGAGAIDFKKKLRLKGKSHEFSDAAKLLNHYQMWLDQLYPRAKFADALQLVEKAGHTKKMQMYRKAWIDEGKPGFVRREDVDAAVERLDAERIDEPTVPSHLRSRVSSGHEAEEDPAAMFFGNGDDDEEQDAVGPDDDELDALLAQRDEAPKATRQPIVDADSEGEDDLDALLAQQDSHKRNVAPMAEDEDELDVLMEEHNAAVNKPRQDTGEPGQADEEDDELDAILNTDSQNIAFEKSIPPSHDDFDGDAEDFAALLTSDGSAREPELPTLTSQTYKFKAINHEQETGPPSTEEVPSLDSNPTSSSPVPNVQTDELDDLMDEHDATLAKQKMMDSSLVGGMLSSSPVPNGESQ